MQIFVPADAPHRIILATNFGLIISDDDGATWEWSCEPRNDDNTILYQKAASPSQRIFAVLIAHPMVYTDDLACTWTPSGGSLATLVARDAFADPTSADRVLAAAVPPASTLQPSSVYRSTDGGLTFGPALISGPAGGDILGVENAVSDPATMYVAMYGSANNADRSDPRAVDRQRRHLELDGPRAACSARPPSASSPSIRPTRATCSCASGVSSGGEKLGVSTDGGLTFTEPVSVDKQLTAFVRLASGTILVAGLDTNDSPVGFRSTDGGATFVPWVKPPHLRALAERDGKLYAAADNFLDMFAAGVSTDEGATWKPLLTYDQVKRVKACVQNVCQDVCDNLAGLTLWPQSVCGDADAGSTPMTTPKSGCGCRAAGDGGGGGGWRACIAAAVAAQRAARRAPPPETVVGLVVDPARAPHPHTTPQD